MKPTSSDSSGKRSRKRQRPLTPEDTIGLLAAAVPVPPPNCRAGTHVCTRGLHPRPHAVACLHWDPNVDLPPERAELLRLSLEANSGPRTGHLEPPPKASTWAANLSRGIVEVIIGLRPPVQLQRWVQADLLAEIVRVRATHPIPRAAIGRCEPILWRACELKPTVVETGVVLALPYGRCIVAIRLENYRGRWLATALDLA